MIGRGRPPTASDDCRPCQLIARRTRSAVELPPVCRPRLEVSRDGVVDDRCPLRRSGSGQAEAAADGTARGEMAVNRGRVGDATTTAAVVVDAIGGHDGSSWDPAPPSVAWTRKHGGVTGLPQICCSSADRSRMRSSHERPPSALLPLLPLDRPYDVDRKSRRDGIS